MGFGASTKWSGSGPNGVVKGIGDLSAGMFAIVDVVNSGGLLATSVEAFGATPPELFAWRGPVETITQTAWTIAGRGVNVDSDTKIVGDPKVGDIVDVVALVHDAPLGFWKISSRDVLVNRLTKLDSGIAVGSSVHVKGTFVASTNGGNLFATLFVATSITKNN